MNLSSLFDGIVERPFFRTIPSDASSDVDSEETLSLNMDSLEEESGDSFRDGV